MKQERLKRSYEWVDGLMGRTGNLRKLYPWQQAQINAALRIYRPLRYAAAKAIEKPVRMDGNRAFCPDCGTGVKKKDNYCRICGQRLAARQQDGKKPFYMVFDEKHYYGR